MVKPGRVAQSVGHLTRMSGVLGSIPGRATYFRFSFRFSRRAVVSYWRKYVHEVLVNRLGGLSLPRKSVVRLTDRPDMTLDVYRGRKTTIQPTNYYGQMWRTRFHYDFSKSRLIVITCMHDQLLCSIYAKTFGNIYLKTRPFASTQQHIEVLL